MLIVNLNRVTNQNEKKMLFFALAYTKSRYAFVVIFEKKKKKIYLL